jgi:transposase-like protein
MRRNRSAFEMVTSAKRRSEREQFWRRVIREQQQSGASIKAFCQAHGVSQPAYFAWRKKLALGKRTNDRGDFVPVQVVRHTAVQPGGIEIVLSRGRRVRHLADVLRRLPTTPADQLVELLPDVWLQAHPNAARKRAA